MNTANLFYVIPRPSMKSSMRISSGWTGSIKSVSAVVDELDIYRTSISPDKAESPLRVHANTVLPTPVANKPFQTVAWRNPKILNTFAAFICSSFRNDAR